jgi:hypothetical protein
VALTNEGNLAIIADLIHAGDVTQVHANVLVNDVNMVVGDCDVNVCAAVAWVHSGAVAIVSEVAVDRNCFD